MPPPPNLDFLPFARSFYSRNFSIGPQKQEDHVRKVAATPHVEVSLVVGASTSAVPLGSAPPPQNRIELAKENMDLVQVHITEC